MNRKLTALRNVAKLFADFRVVDEAPRARLHVARVAAVVVAACQLRVVGRPQEYLVTPITAFEAGDSSRCGSPIAVADVCIAGVVCNAIVIRIEFCAKN